MWWNKKKNVVDMSKAPETGNESPPKTLTKAELAVIEEQKERQRTKEHNLEIANRPSIDEKNVIEGINNINFKLNSDTPWHRELVNRFSKPLYYAVVTEKRSTHENRRFTRAELDKIANHFREQGFKVRVVPEDSWYHEHVEVFIGWYDE